MIEWGQRKTCKLVKSQNVFSVENSGIIKCVFSTKMGIKSKNIVFCLLKFCPTTVIQVWFTELVAQ